MDDDFEWVRDRYTSISRTPSEYVKRNCWMTCEVDEKLLPVAIAELGEDRICMASDYPHFDSEFPHTVSGIQERIDLTDRQKKLILGDNVARLLNVA